jgi:threonine/homoserine/homoserine lactone efflux protein
VTAGRLAEFCATSLVVILVPGPSVLFVVARGIAWGRAVAVLTVLGNGLGILVLASVVALGLGPLLARSSAFTEGIEVAGGAYLVWLSFDALRHRAAHAAALAATGAPRPARVRAVRDGFVVGVLNPKALVYFVAVLPHFVATRSAATGQLLVLGTLFAAIAVVCDGTWGVLAGTARDRLLASPRVLVTLRTAGGVVLLGLGALVLVSALVRPA